MDSADHHPRHPRPRRDHRRPLPRPPLRPVHPPLPPKLTAPGRRTPDEHSRGTTGRIRSRPAGSSITSYGADPATVMLAVSRTARTYDLLQQVDEFGVHLLASDQTELAGIFAGHQDDKFADTDWEWDGPVPRVSGAKGPCVDDELSGDSASLSDTRPAVGVGKASPLWTGERLGTVPPADRFRCRLVGSARRHPSGHGADRRCGAVRRLPVFSKAAARASRALSS
ncbi:flavin reductase [Streptomyces sp. NPDC002082]|uniref:flavin reductase family protein n=1 Tax=Streptomyces sp. NPDC002082 TaxID=3154772 RepID=UPI003331B3E2